VRVHYYGKASAAGQFKFKKTWTFSRKIREFSRKIKLYYESNHTYMKTYCMKYLSHEMTPALYVKSAHQDLLSNKACNRAGIRVILDEDPKITGLYPLDKEKRERPEDSIPFISEPRALYLLKIEEMDWRKFHKTNDFGLWHRRLMHCANRNILETIPYLEGLEKLLNHCSTNTRRVLNFYDWKEHPSRYSLEC
jgi:hypothetical protein